MTNNGHTNGSKLVASLAHLPHAITNHAHISRTHEAAFVGRMDELIEIARHFQNPDCRLVNLVGLGGVGKTRIAWETATHLSEKFPHGVYFIPLAAIATPDLLVPAIASALGYSFQGSETPQIQIINFLRSRHLLLILDNFEHLISSGVDLLVEILQAAPDVRLLITSRERINLREEWVIDIRGLDYPADENTAENYSAVQLFVQNARQLKADFQLTDANRADIVRICRLVEGLPLAIELAAVWVRVLSCRAIADEIAHNLDFLTTNLRNMPEKHRSMRAVFARSYDSLMPEQQQVFNKLSVFRGGFQRDAAAVIAGASLKTLADLVDKSLLSVDDQGRYSIHELLRQYGDEQLEAAGEGSAAHHAHSTYYADFLDQRVEDLKGRRQVAALLEIRSDFENIRTAWHWAAAGKHESILDHMLEGLWLYCNIDSRYEENLVMMRYAKAQLASGYDSEQLWGRLLSRAVAREDAHHELDIALQIADHHTALAEVGYCLMQLAKAAYARGEFDRIKPLLEQGLEVYRRLDDHYYVAKVLSELQSLNYMGSWEEFIGYGGESYRLSREIGDRVGASWSVSAVAMDHARKGRFAESEQSWLERITLGYEIGNLTLVANGKGHISHKIYFVLGDFDQARATAEDALRIAVLLGDSNRAGQGWALADLGLLACVDENYHEAKQLLQQAASVNVTMWTTDLATWGLSMAACGLGDYDAARVHLSKVFDFLAKIHGLPGVIQYLAVAAVILAHRGDSLRAVEILGLAFSHPIRAAGWMEKWPLLTRLRADLERTHGTAAYMAAWERGKKLDLETEAAQLRAYLDSDEYMNQQKMNQPLYEPPTSDQPLYEPLTEREIEVLRLLASGLSNQGIADQLVISLGKVKAHTNNIYSKLGVNSRVQAIVQAKRLGIL